MAVPGPTTQQAIDTAAGNLLRLARLERGWSQRQLAAAAEVPPSTVGRIEAGLRQPSLPTLMRLIAAAGLELRIRVEPYDDHDDVLDARRAAAGPAQRAEQDARAVRNTALLSEARRVMLEQEASGRVGPVEAAG